MFRLWKKLWSLRGWISGALCAGLLAIGLCDWHVGNRPDGAIVDRAKAAPRKPVALVLGTSKYVVGGGINVFYQQRIEGAAALFHAGKVRGILVSGDHGTPYYNEPDQMKADLVALDVPAAFITCDYAGFRTLDSIVRIEEVFQETSYIVVSQDFHVRRALYIAEDLGHDAVGLAVRMPEGYWGTKVRLREVLARVKVVLDVEVLHTQPRYLGETLPVAKRPESSG